MENALRVGALFRGSRHPLQNIFEKCGNATLEVLGVLNPKLDARQDHDYAIVAYTERSVPYPRIHLPYHPKAVTQLVIFATMMPNRMQYMSLKPMSLAIEHKLDSPDSESGWLEIDVAERAEKQRLAALVEKMRLHTVVKHSPTTKELMIPIILSQINCAFELNALLQKNIGLVRLRSRRTLSVSERVVESATNLWDYLWWLMAYIFYNFAYPVATRIFMFGLISHRIAGEGIVMMADWRLTPQGVALKDISATAQQVDLRLQQFCYWPVQYLTLQKSKDDWESVTNNHAEYIRFYNSLWLVANDVIMGIAVGTFVIENADSIAAQADMYIGTLTIDGLRRMISWLMVYPAGLKLNTELAVFLGDLFLWVIDYWAGKVSQCPSMISAN